MPSFGNWPPVDGGSPLWLALIPSAGGAPALQTPGFIANVVNTGPGVYAIELGALGDQIPTPLGQPISIVAPAGGAADARAWAAQTIQAPPDPWIFEVSLSPATNVNFLFALAFGNPLLQFP